MQAWTKAGRASIVAASGVCWAAIAAAYPVNSTLTIDSTQSNLTVAASAIGLSDSDSHNLTGTIDVTFDFGQGGSFPASSEMTITGGSVAPDAAYKLTLGFPPFLGVSMNASGLVGTFSTVTPPGMMTRTADTSVVYQFDASQYLFTVNQGTIVVTGSTEETTDLSAEPVTGSADPGTLGTMTFTSLGTNGPYTHLSALLNFPIDITHTSETDSGLMVDTHLTGTVRATSTFYVALAGVPGDFNLDGAVSVADLPVFKSHYGLASGATAATGDADGNGSVDGNDFLVWQRTLGTRPPGSGAAPVPEPAAGLLAAFAITVLTWRQAALCA